MLKDEFDDDGDMEPSLGTRKLIYVQLIHYVSCIFIVVHSAVQTWVHVSSCFKKGCQKKAQK